MTATILPFRKNCKWNDGGACLAKSPFACVCQRPETAAVLTIGPFGGRKALPKPNPHSPMHTSLLMQPGRDAGSIGATPEIRALEHAEMITAISEPAKSIDDVIKALPQDRREKIEARASSLIAEIAKTQDLIAFAKTGGPVIDDDLDFSKAFPSADAKTTTIEIKNVYSDIVLPIADESGC